MYSYSAVVCRISRLHLAYAHCGRASPACAPLSHVSGWVLRCVFIYRTSPGYKGALTFFNVERQVQVQVHFRARTAHVPRAYLAAFYGMLLGGCGFRPTRGPRLAERFSAVGGRGRAGVVLSQF